MSGAAARTGEEKGKKEKYRNTKNYKREVKNIITND